MKEFSIVFKGGVTEWLKTTEWTLADMKQWNEFNDYYIEYR